MTPERKTMEDTESKAMDVLNEILGHIDFPRERLKVIDLNWDQIYGEYFPVLHCEFYEEKEE